MNKNPVTERDIRMPEFRDAKLEDLEFDASGEVVRKDRFERSMRKISGMLHGVNGLSPREGWTCEQVVEAVKITIRDFQRLTYLIQIIDYAPDFAEFYHFDNKTYVKDINQEQLKISKNEPEIGHLVSHLTCKFKEKAWQEDSAWIDYINVLVSITDIKKELCEIVGVPYEDE